MSTLTHLETDTGTNVNISSATNIGAYTSNADRLVMVDVSINQVAGGGDYLMYVTRQVNGSGAEYKILPKTTMTADAGDTSISGQSGWVTVRNGDVLKVWVKGLAGDATTPDWSTRWFEQSVDLSAVAKSSEIASISLLNETVVGGYSVQDVLKLLAAKIAGKVTGGATPTITYRGIDDATNVIVETVDDKGNRSSVVLTV